ncbi:MAG: hypothetical protein ACTSX9_06380 [Candidatus Njordarchaeales archaeon]
MALDLDIGELHCASKHLASSYEIVGEIIEKLIRLGLDYENIVKTRGLIEALWIRLLRVIRGHLEGNYLINSVAEIIDIVRKIRATLHNTLYDTLLSKWNEALFVEFLKSIGNLYNVEIHLLDYLVSCLKEAMKNEHKEVVKEEAKA